MFGTSGIRGIYGKEITEELAGRIASIFVSAAGAQKLVIGRDIRESGKSLFEAASSGSGAEVIDLGVVPTPTAALGTKRHDCPGIMLTASHNPSEYNGLKLIQEGKEIGKGLEKEITRRYKDGEGSGNASRGVYHDLTAIEGHKEMIRGMVDGDAITKRRPKVIVDCNGAASVITPYLLSELGCRVVSVNSSQFCFNRPSEPKGDSLPYLGDLVRSSRADFAIAHDGDGDRCVVFDETGSMLSFDVQLAIMIEHELGLGKNKKIISTIEASLAIRDVVERTGGSIEITPVGSTFVGDRMEESGALFGGEPCGEYIYKDGVHVPDAILAAAKFAEILAERGAFSEMKTKYPQNFIGREKFPAKDKHAAMDRIRKGIRIEGRLRSDDGIRVDEEDGWLLVRASGTEPIVRLTLEYKTKEKLEKRKKQLTELILKQVG